jgi:hypothetical protein
MRYKKIQEWSRKKLMLCLEHATINIDTKTSLG